MLPTRRWLRYVLVLSFFFGAVIPFLLFLLTNTYGVLETESSLLEGRSRLYSSREANRRPLEVSNRPAEEVQYQVEELQRIVVSVRNELRELESERNRLKREVDSSKTTLSKVRKEVGIAKSSLQESKGKLAKSLRDTKRATQNDDNSQETAVKSDIVVVKLPEHSAVQPGQRSEPQATLGEGPVFECTDAACFDYSRCPLTSPFSVYLYNQHQSDLFDLKYPATLTDLVHSLQEKHSLATNPDSACIFVVVVGPLKVEVDEKALRKKLELLPHWKESGRNHIIVSLPYFNESYNTNLNSLGQSILAKGHASNIEKKGFNILLPPVTRRGDDAQPAWRSLPPLLPALRQYLVVHEGYLWEPKQQAKGLWISPDHLSSWGEAITSNTKDKVLVGVRCGGTADRSGVTGAGAGTRKDVGKLGEWGLCGSAAQRASLLSKATFSLVLRSQSGISGPETYTRLIEGLRYGAIPVILGIDHLPFGSVIEWKRAAIVLPVSAFGQLHFILRNIAPENILQYRRQGRFLWDTYFSSPLRILETALVMVRQRALHPPPAAPQFTTATNLVSVPGDYHVLPSPHFLYNFTLYSEELWNSPPGPLYMYPTTPFKPRPVSGSQYTGLTSKQLSNLPPHVVDAGGITGPFFEDYLLGNTPEEQFTVVMLTYERNEVLLDALVRLTDLDYLAKVVVVWNNPNPPPSDMKWPEIGVAIDVVSVGRNSLNNRFLPFSNINTEAVLSIDDDVHLRHDEIQFAFRVWREARDRVVGFPGRFHAWDTRHSSWLYNSNYTCELSMVLTGAAFIHKYYMFLYSDWLYAEARALVDRHMNCEDIAMNFLVSHITRKPPLKVTSRWTFRCPGCPETLSSSDVHFNERHVCINQLVEMFGYMPLLYTQFRLDSILFKTRISSHLEKCYEFI